MSDIEKVIDRVRKLLALSTSANEHEAAAAAARAADLMREHQLEEAQMRVDDPNAGPASPIDVETVDGGGARKNYWKGTIASACARSVGARMYWHGPQVRMFGRQDAIRTASYLFQYLANEVNRLADEHWAVIGFHADGSRAWKNAFRLGAATTIGNRLDATRAEFEKAQAVEASTETALTLVRRDDLEVADKYKTFSGGFRSARGPSFSSGEGFSRGRSAGESVALGGGRAIGSTPRQLS